MIYDVTTGQRIQYLRNKYGISLDELAEIVGVSADMIKKYEKEIIKKVPYEQIERMAPALHTSIGYLLCWEPAVFEANVIVEPKKDEELIDAESEPSNVFFEMSAKIPEERDEIINTGVFKSYIEGYLTLTLRSIGYPESEINYIRHVLKSNVFKQVTAKEARKAGEILGVSVKRQSTMNEAGKKSKDNGKIYIFPGRYGR